MHELQTDISRHTKSWYPIFTRAGGSPITLTENLSAWTKRLSTLSEAAIAVQEAKEARKADRAP